MYTYINIHSFHCKLNLIKKNILKFAGLLGGAALGYGASKMIGHGFGGWGLGHHGSWGSMSSFGSAGSFGSIGSFDWSWIALYLPFKFFKMIYIPVHALYTNYCGLVYLEPLNLRYNIFYIVGHQYCDTWMLFICTIFKIINYFK